MNHTKEEVLNHLTQDLYCRLGVSGVEGVGVFAIRPIAQGVHPLRSWLPKDEVRVEFADLKKLPQSIRKQIDMFCYVNHEEEYADVPCIGLNAMNISIYLNHSKTPNWACDEQGELVALRNIKPGEELFIDYDESFGDVHIF